MKCQKNDDELRTFNMRMIHGASERLGGEHGHE